MAEHDDDREVSRRYRDLGREEPPPELDAAVLAEARRAATTHPAPLVPPTGRRRWYFPVAAAAIIMLAVAVTVQMEREQRDAESVVPPASAPPATPAPAKEAPAPAKEAAEKRNDESGAPAAAGAPMPSRSLSTIEPPEQALERIAQLRAQGRNEEADRALAEFRKRYPEFRIPPEMLRRVERR